MTGWESKIVGHEKRKVSELQANPANWRVHPKGQQKALAAMLGEVGYAKSITINTTTGNIVDGHLRLELAKLNQEEEIDCELVELTEEEERIILATLDPIGAMAGTDRGVYAELMKSLEPTDQALRDFYASIIHDYALDMVPGKSPAPDDGDQGGDDGQELPQGMRMMQLMYTPEEHGRLTGAMEKLSTRWGTKPGTETIQRAVREAAV